ncbi:hypothetical protein MMC24_003483 [Lignoscripta atroalba]|nr:hypothetical protein [Lignoscripta atroalba]
MESSGEQPNGPATAAQSDMNHSQVKSSSEAGPGASAGKDDLPSVPPLKRASTTPRTSNTSSSATSPKPSREPSPIRPPLKPGTSASSNLNRSRKNSQELSPHRTQSIPAVPSAAAIQRALSATGTPQIVSPATPDFLADVTRIQRPSKVLSGAGTPLGAISPRLKSPPPSAAANRNPVYSPRKLEQPLPPPTPSITVEHPSQNTKSSTEIGLEGEEALVRSGIRTPVRSGTLETVQESSLPATPAIGAGRTQPGGKTNDSRPEKIDENPVESAFTKGIKASMESGSESGGNKSGGNKGEGRDARKPAMAQNPSKPPVIHPKKSVTQLNSTKGKIGGEGSAKNMTVETETVSSVPHVAVGGGTGERGVPGRTDAGGSIRLKPSNETIRPKRDKKRTVRKAPSINAGTGGSSSRRFHHHHIYSRAPSPENTFSQTTVSPDPLYGYLPDHFDSVHSLRPPGRPEARVLKLKVDSISLHLPSKPRQSNAGLTTFRGRTASSKADIFEAKVASAVDEANSSDSEETFVYESNPPEPLSARPHRYHSRTPSATSMASQMDQYSGRLRQDGHHSIAGKKSMKFANNTHHVSGTYGEMGEHGGTIAGHGGRTSGGHTSHHHHIGRYGRGGAGHTSLFDNESPFPNAAKPLRNIATNVARLSPRSPHILRIPGTSAKTSAPLSYDIEGEGADDERTPLIGSIRSGRTRNSRRPLSGSLRQAEYDEEKTRRCRSVTYCVLLGGLGSLLIAAVVLALVICSKPLLDVHVKDIQNVLASEQEIMLDLHVHAINPNLIAIQVNELDVNIFAKSKYVGSSAFWREDHRFTKSKPRVPSSHMPDYSNPGLSKYAVGTSNPYRVREGVDEGNDPIDDPGSDSQTMLLGRIFEFDSPLIFDASPIRHESFSSVGEVRLAEPGNRTEQGGSERWEKVIQHPFELIVRGVLRYSLPMSSKIKSASIGGSVTVRPEASVDQVDDVAGAQSRRTYADSRHVLRGADEKEARKIEMSA